MFCSSHSNCLFGSCGWSALTTNSTRFSLISLITSSFANKRILGRTHNHRHETFTMRDIPSSSSREREFERERNPPPSPFYYVHQLIRWIIQTRRDNNHNDLIVLVSLLCIEREREVEERNPPPLDIIFINWWWKSSKQGRDNHDPTIWYDPLHVLTSNLIQRSYDDTIPESFNSSSVMMEESSKQEETIMVLLYDISVGAVLVQYEIFGCTAYYTVYSPYSEANRRGNTV